MCEWPENINDKYVSEKDKIIKIQARYRGHVVRNKMNTERKDAMKTTKINEPGQRPGRKEVSVVPNYSNPDTRATEQRLGPFKYEIPKEETETNLENRGPFELDNEAIYVGQWNKEGLRHGKGVQIWPDGSKYEGYWKIGRAHV